MLTLMQTQKSMQTQKMTRASRKNGYSSSDLGFAFGFSHVKIADLVNAGYLHGEKVLVWKREVYSFSADDALTFLQKHVGLFEFNPSRRWKPVVEEARRYFDQKYISKKEIMTRYGLSRQQIQRRTKNHGFPRPTTDFRQSSAIGTWYERAAIEHWITENA